MSYNRGISMLQRQMLEHMKQVERMIASPLLTQYYSNPLYQRTLLPSVFTSSSIFDNDPFFNDIFSTRPLRQQRRSLPKRQQQQQETKDSDKDIAVQGDNATATNASSVANQQQQSYYDNPYVNSLFDWSPYNIPDIFNNEQTKQFMLDLKLDVVEKDNEYNIRVDIPGVSKDNINLHLHNDILTIRAEKQQDIDEPDESFHTTSHKPDTTATTTETTTQQQDTTEAVDSAKDVDSEAGATKSSQVQAKTTEEANKPAARIRRSERSYGMVERSLNLPDDVDLEHITASYDNGVLTINLPRIKTEQKQEGKKINIA